MEETIIEIPDAQEGWQPPVLTHVTRGKRRAPQRITDIFFAQYSIAVVLILSVFILRLFDVGLGNQMLLNFQSNSQAPTLAGITQFFAFLSSLWS